MSDTRHKVKDRSRERGGTVMNVRQALSLIKLGAPLHPILVHFTIALTSISFVFDGIGYFFGVASLGEAGWWTLTASIVATFFTLATGVTSRMRMPVEDVEEGESRSFLRAHMAIGPIFFGLLLMAGIWRAVLWESGRGVSWEYLLAISLVVLVMGLQGYLGGELVYRYGAEVEMNYRELPVGGAKSSVPALPGATAAPKATAWGNLEARRE